MEHTQLPGETEMPAAIRLSQHSHVSGPDSESAPRIRGRPSQHSYISVDSESPSLQNVSQLLDALKELPNQLKQVQKTLKKLQGQSDSILRGQAESRAAMQKLDPMAMGLAPAMGAPAPPRTFQPAPAPSFMGARAGFQRQASRGNLDAPEKAPSEAGGGGMLGAIRRTSVAIGMGGNPAFFARPMAVQAPPLPVPVPGGSTRRASLAFNTNAPPPIAPEPLTPILPVCNEAEEEDGFSDDSDSDLAPSPTGKAEENTETRPDGTTPETQSGPKPPTKSVHLKIEEKDEESISLAPSMKSGGEEGSKQPQNWTLKGAQVSDSGEASRLSSMRSRAWQDDGSGGEFSAPSSRFLLMPDSVISIGWNLIMMVCILMLAGILPIQLTYLWAEPLPSDWVAAIILADICLILDVPVSFITTSLDRKTLQLMEFREVAIHYARSWLLVDLLAIWPMLLTSEPQSPGFIVHRLLKLVKVLKMRYWIPRLEDQFQSKKTSWAKMSGAMLLLVHSLGCCWFIVRHGLQPGVPGTAEDYVADVYFVVMALTSVGFGDIIPVGPGARLYCVMVMLASSLFSGVLVAFVAQALRTVFDDEVEKYVWQASEFMRKRKVPSDLQKRVEHGLRQKFQQELSLSVAPKILSNLSPSSQRELALELLRSAVMAFPVFQEAPEGFVGQLASAFTWVQSLAGDLVVEEGQLEEELVFVIEGALLKLHSLDPFEAESEEDEEDSDGIKKDLMSRGAWFGERCLFQDDSLRDFTVITEIDSELAVLSAVDYMRILKLYPRLHRQHEQLVTAIEKGRMDLADLAYKAGFHVQDGVRGCIPRLLERFLGIMR